MDSLRKLLVLGTNELLLRGKVTLDGGGRDLRSEDEKGHIFADILGKPAVILWQDIGFEELRISVWWNYDHSRHPQAEASGNSRESFVTSSPLAKRQHYPKFVGAVASGWLERKSGKYLQGTGRGGIFDAYIRRDSRQILDAAVDPIPEGYRPQGSVHM